MIAMTGILRRVAGALLLFVPFLLFAHPEQPFRKMGDGVIIYPNAELAGNAQAIRLQVITEHIIRVIASPKKEFPERTSLIAIYNKEQDQAAWQLDPDTGQKLTIRTRFITAIADLATGNVVFYDAAGKQILAEKKMGRELEQTVSEGERTYAIHQEFETSPDDAWYGLGQHQDGVVNYKGSQVFLFQNNTEVAVPFLVSRKNYGILWDNSSISLAGDTRRYKDISSLKLYSKDGEPGWLTATYYNNKNTSDIYLQRPESSIRYEYLHDSFLHLPAGFNPSDGKLVWEGCLGSEFSGTHMLRFTYAGYMKVWIDGKLVLDRWRMAWNPCVAVVEAAFVQGKKLPVKIEWIPDGGESYAAFKWLEPVDKADENSFGFASEAGQEMDYYFIQGNNIDEVISGYRTLTGKAAILPQWAFGLWQSRERYKTQDEILNTVKEFRRRKIGLDNIVLDWSYWKENQWGSQEFESGRFPNPDSMISVLHKQYNSRFMISVWPKFYEGIDSYKEFDKNGWLYKRNIADRQKDWIAKGYVSTFYDAFNEDAQKGFWKLLDDKLYKKGVDAWWMDASEPDILSNVSPQKRKEQMYPLSAGITSEYINAYPLVNAKGIYEGQRSVDPNKRVCILTRSAFPGLQRYSAATWSGDISSRWHDMKLQIAAGINYSLSGLPYWSMDIGGFAVERRYEHPDSLNLDEWREMNARWYQFGAFVPLFRVHGQYPYREIYNVSPEDHACYKSMLYYNKLRYRLLPYIYSLAGSAYLDDYTIMRGLVMDFPNDDSVVSISDQYMFGPSLLINPVYNYHQRNRELYLPGSQGWYDLYTGRHSAGGKSVIADAPYERMPVFVKEGSILPFGPALQYTGEKAADSITLYVYTGKNGAFTLYEDGNTNYDYEKGSYSTIPITYNEATRTLTIEERKGTFAGMLRQRSFRVVWITPSKPVGLDLERNDGRYFTYKGKTINVKAD